MNVLISNLIASIKVSLKHKVFTSKTRHSLHVECVVKKLIDLGVLKDYERMKIGGTNYLSFSLNLIEGRPLLYDIKVVSKSGRKMYSKIKELKFFKGVYIDLLVSTSKGIFNYQECLINNIGGEVICVYT